MIYPRLYVTFNMSQCVACVALRFLSNSQSTLRKRGGHDNERQSREEPGRETTKKPTAQTYEWPAFFVSLVGWRTGHCHWFRRLTRELKFRLSPKGQLQGTTLITTQIFGVWTENNWESIVESVFVPEYSASRITRNCQLPNTRKKQPWTICFMSSRKIIVVAVFPTGYQSRSLTVRVTVWVHGWPKNCRLREPVSLLFRC